VGATSKIAEVLLFGASQERRADATGNVALL
jgi:hypothetical protein